jgi:hypothetical protein
MGDEASNPNNPYDYIGAVHYQLINYGFENDLFVIYDDELDREVCYETIINQLPIFLENNFFPTSDCEQYYDFEAIETTLSNIDSFDQYITNPNLLSILTEYDDYMESSANFFNFHQYSIQKENEIIENPNFLEIEKQIVLSYMATARYGYWDWDLILGLD